MTISPADMVLFAVVVREGSFTRAARQLGITKQTASERISNLEQRLGVRLLERTTRQVRVSASGATYYDRCASIAAQIDDANNEVQHQQTDPVGLMRVSAPALYGRRYLAPVVSTFLGQYPQARVELVLADRRVNLVEDGFDVGIQVGPLDDSSLVARKLGDGAMYCVASPKFLARAGRPQPNELRRARCIGLGPFETWEVGGVKARIDPVLAVNDYEVACDAALAGVGIARVPTIVCQDAVADGRLVLVFGRAPTAVRPVHLVVPSRRHSPPIVRRFVDALVTLVKPMTLLPSGRRPSRAHPAT